MADDNATDRRKQRRQDTADRIVDAALEVITNEGLEALTVQRLARELEYAVGAVYRYFRSKDAILTAVVGRVLDAIGADIDRADERLDAHLRRARPPLDAGPSALLRLLVVAGVYASLASRRPAQTRLLTRFVADPRTLVAIEDAVAMVPNIVGIIDRVAALFSAAVAAGALDEGDARRRTVMLWTALQGAVQLDKFARYDLPELFTEGLGLELASSLFRGWGADAEAVETLRPRVTKLVRGLVSATNTEA